MKMYTLFREFDSIQLTADEMLAEMDKQEALGNHIEYIAGKFGHGEDEDVFLLCYW